MRRFSYPERMRHVFHQVHAMPLRMRPSTSAGPLLSLWGRAFTGAAHASPDSHRSFAHARQAGTSHHIHKTRPLPFGPVLLRVRQLFRQAHHSPASGFAKWTHYTTSAELMLRLWAAFVKRGAGAAGKAAEPMPPASIISHLLNSCRAFSSLYLPRGRTAFIRPGSIPCFRPYAVCRRPRC